MNEVAKKCIHLRFHGSAYIYVYCIIYLPVHLNLRGGRKVELLHTLWTYSQNKRMFEWLAYSSALKLFCTETSDFVRRQLIYMETGDFVWRQVILYEG